MYILHNKFYKINILHNKFYKINILRYKYFINFTFYYITFQALIEFHRHNLYTIIS